MRKEVGTIALRASTALAILIIGYLIVGKLPVSFSKSILRNTQHSLGIQENSILQRDLLIGELAGLDTRAPNFSSQHSHIIDEIGDSLKQPTNHVSAPFAIPGMMPEANYINGQLQADLKTINANADTISSRQSESIKRGLIFDRDIQNIFLYSPTTDLIRADEPGKLEVLSARSKAAADGLTVISNKLNDPRSELAARLSAAVGSLNRLKSSAGTGDLTATEAARQTAISQITELQNSALGAELARMRKGYPDTKPLISSYGPAQSRLAAAAKLIR